MPLLTSVILTRARCIQARTPGPCTHLIHSGHSPDSGTPRRKPNGKSILAKKKSLGAHSECNVEKKVAYVCCFRDPKSLGAHSGDRSIFVLAYLTALLRGHFLILQYLTWFLRGRFSVFAYLTWFLRGCVFSCCLEKVMNLRECYCCRATAGCTFF